MRHNRYKYKLGVSPSHRTSLVRNLCVSLIEHSSIKTTHAKCKALRPVIERLVTLSKTDSVANRRLAYKKLNNRSAVTNLFVNLGPKFKERKGGYTRITKVADGRVGDNAAMGHISFVE